MNDHLDLAQDDILDGEDPDRRAWRWIRFAFACILAGWAVQALTDLGRLESADPPFCKCDGDSDCAANCVEVQP